MTSRQQRLTLSPAHVCVIAAIGILAFAASARSYAASISYGDFGPVPPGVSFLDVTESSGTDPVPLYNAPTAFATGLLFPNVNLVAHSTDGNGDFTDGQLNFMITNAAGVQTIGVSEFGSYELSTLGAADALVRATTFIGAVVTQVNGINVAPINLTPAIASFSDETPPDESGGWSLGALMNVAAQLGPNSRATKVNVVIDNRLTALSEPGSGAFIDKKGFRLTVGIIPEPASFALAGIALCGILAAGRRRVEA